MSIRFDKLGVVVALLIAYGALAAPFATFRANRIVPGDGKGILDALPAGAGILLFALMVCAALIVLFKTPTRLRLFTAAAGLAAIAVFVGMAATFLTPAGNSYARVSPASRLLDPAVFLRPSGCRFDHQAAALAAGQGGCFWQSRWAGRRQS